MSFCYIGSAAVQAELNRKPNDIDAIADFETAKDFLQSQECNIIYPINQGKTLVGRDRRGTIFEISIAWPGSTNAEFLEIVGDRSSATINEVYTLKMSHRYLRNSPHFYKTMADIKRLRELGAQIPDDLKDWFKRREKETYDYSHPSLDQSKNNFFSDDGINYKYDHDSLHKAVAIWDQKPMYTRYQRDGSEVLCDRQKWKKLSPAFKAFAVAEEAAVLALERSLIPFPNKWSAEKAFKYALMKVCTSITSGWFREYAWEHHDEIIELIQTNDYDYYGLFEQGLVQGIVKPYVGN